MEEIKCTNPELGRFALLSDREADEKLTDSVREHLSVCSYCAKKRRAYGDWLNSLKSNQEPHLETDVLLAYQHIPLTPEQQRRTENHLATCRQCSEALVKLNSAFDAAEQLETNTSEAVPGWAGDRESAFVDRMKRELELSGQLERHGPWGTESRRKAQAHSWRGPWSVSEWSVAAVAALIIIAVTVLITTTRWMRSTPGDNQNLVGKESPPATPLPTKHGQSDNQNVTVHQPVQQPTRKPKSTTSSPEPPAVANTQVFAFILEPTRAPSARREITVSRAFIRFEVRINGPAVSRSFRVELIDEETGRTIGGQQQVNAQLVQDYREVVFTSPTNDLINTFYTLRLTGLSPTGKPAEVFTTYLKLAK